MKVCLFFDFVEEKCIAFVHLMWVLIIFWAQLLGVMITQSFRVDMRVCYHPLPHFTHRSQAEHVRFVLAFILESCTSATNTLWLGCG